jgi:hypothetical protein
MQAGQYFRHSTPAQILVLGSRPHRRSLLIEQQTLQLVLASYPVIKIAQLEYPVLRPGVLLVPYRPLSLADQPGRRPGLLVRLVLVVLVDRPLALGAPGAPSRLLERCLTPVAQQVPEAQLVPEAQGGPMAPLGLLPPKHFPLVLLAAQILQENHIGLYSKRLYLVQLFCYQEVSPSVNPFDQH